MSAAIPSFVDLRSFVAGLPPADAVGPVRRLLSLPQGPASVGALHLGAGRHEEVVDADEFVIVHEGRVVLASDGAEVALGPGDSAVIRSGTRLHWQADAPAALSFMRYRAPADAAGIVGIDYQAELSPSGAPLAELLTTPTPSCRNYTDYRSGDGEFMCGTWDSTPYARKPMRYRHHELMHLLEGEVAFVDAAGNAATFRRGDIFLVPQGAECSWDSAVHVRKVYAIWRPA